MKKYAKYEAAIVVLLLLLIILGSYVLFIKAPKTLVKDSYTVSTTNIPSEFDGFKIGYFSDVVVRDEKDVELLKRTVDLINKGQYDLVLFGGDLFYNALAKQDEVRDLLTKVEAKYGKFAVLGEKDLITNADTTSILNLGGFEVLKDQAIPIYYHDATLLLIGLESEVNIDTLVPEQYSNYYKVVLSHMPDSFDASTNEDGTNNIDLQLSGHSHGGYTDLPIFDVNQKRSGATKYVNGEYNINLSTIIVSHGVNEEPNAPMRLFCSPDIVSVTLEAK